MAGNRAVATLLQRQPTKTPVKPKAPVPKKPRPPTPAEMRDRAKALHKSTDATWKRLEAFVDESDPRLEAVERKVRSYLANYSRAYTDFSGVLKQAKADAARRQAMIDAVVGLATGTGIGLAAGTLIKATSLLRRVVTEVVAEAGELAASKAGGGSDKEPSFDPPAELSGDRQAAEKWELMAKGWKSMAKLASPTIKLANVRDGLRDAQYELNQLSAGKKTDKPASEYYARVQKAEQSDLVAKVNAALDVAEKAMASFLAETDTPLLSRNATDLQGDIWVRWITAIHGKRRAIGRVVTGPGDEKIHDALKEGAVRRQLEYLGVLGVPEFEPGEGGDPGRLGVQFDRKPTEAQTFQAYQRAWDERDAMEQIGRLGVVVMPPQQGISNNLGTIHMRADTYAAANRVNTNTNAIQRQFLIADELYQELEVGQIVMVTSTRPLKLKGKPSSGLRVRGLGGSAPLLPVQRHEFDEGLRFLGAAPVKDWGSGTPTPAGGDWKATDLLPFVARAIAESRIPNLRAYVRSGGVVIQDATLYPKVIVKAHRSDAKEDTKEALEYSGAKQAVYLTRRGAPHRPQELRDGSEINGSVAPASYAVQEILAALHRAGAIGKVP